MTVKFPAGIYYVGDPCYVVSYDNWDKLIAETNCFADEEFTFKGKRCFVSGTAYGDGRYYDYQGRGYCVDAGLIGVMPIEVVDQDSNGGGHVITFDKPFEVLEVKGTFFVGHNITIETAGDEDEDEEYYNSSDDEDDEEVYDDEDLE